jgi:hypothetical protein
MPVLYTFMLGINRYYRDVNKEIEVDPVTTFGAKGDYAIVLVGRMQKPVLKALDYAIAAKHSTLEAVHISIDEEQTLQLERDWAEQNIAVPLRIIDSPYRDVAEPLCGYIKKHRETFGSEVVTVYTPVYIVGHWWEALLHNHKSRRLNRRLMLVHGVTIALVPWLLDSSELIYGRRSRPLPGQERRGDPIRPVPRAYTPEVTPDAHWQVRAASRAAESSRVGTPSAASIPGGAGAPGGSGSAGAAQSPTPSVESASLPAPNPQNQPHL